jgi:hypothetical protein
MRPAHRRWGERLEQSAAPRGETEESIQRALIIPHRQEPKLRKLRVAMSLSRLWQQQGMRKAACPWLTPIYGWFTASFDTLDLQKTKALLEELA